MLRNLYVDLLHGYDLLNMTLVLDEYSIQHQCFDWLDIFLKNQSVQQLDKIHALL